MNNSQEKIILTAFHGTSKSSAESIYNHNFRIIQNEEDWLGHGVYFFIDGISCPRKNALEWAENNNKYPVSVIKSTIEVNPKAVLDLRNYDNLKTYNSARLEVINDYYSTLRIRRDLRIKKRKDIRIDDQIITNLIISKLNINVLIHNVYIKNNMQRELILESSYPNATICCVNKLDLISNKEILVNQ